MKYILAIGNPIFNSYATISEEAIQKFGLEWGKTVFANDSNIGFYIYIESQNDLYYNPGGSITNTIRVANVS
jgi:cytochrome oxidase Cu insertion factor (SCO1/SenC/PrrC family)